jgi:hypothetical protein
MMKTQIDSKVLPSLMFCVIHGAVIKNSPIVPLGAPEPLPSRGWSDMDDLAAQGEADPHDPNCWSNQ